MARFSTGLIFISLSLVSLFPALASCEADILPSLQTRNPELVLNAAAVPSQRGQVSDFLRQAAPAGLCVCTTRVFNDGGSQQSLQIPSDYERIFQEVDIIISVARKLEVRLILSSNFRGRRPREIIPSDDLSHIHELVRNTSRNTLRVNTITGVPYKDDPTIMGWQLTGKPSSQVGHRSGSDLIMLKKGTSPNYQSGTDILSSTHLWGRINDFKTRNANADIWLKCGKDNNGARENSIQFSGNDRLLPRRLLNEAFPSPLLVDVSHMSGPVPFSRPSGCTHIPSNEDGHC